MFSCSGHFVLAGPGARLQGLNRGSRSSQLAEELIHQPHVAAGLTRQQVLLRVVPSSEFPARGTEAASARKGQ